MEKIQYSEETNKSEKLAARLAINQKASSIDFQHWLQSHINFEEGSDILDIACGTGAQTIRFLGRVGQSGSVTAIDASLSSINCLKAATSAPNLVAIAGDMMNLESIIQETLPKKMFDVISCTYALYYATDPLKALKTMFEHLNEGGKLAICVPSGPHGLVELVRRHATIPSVVDESLCMGPSVLEPFFAEHFNTYSVSHLKNKQLLHNVAAVMEGLENAAYFNESIRPAVEADVTRSIANNGIFEFYKKSFLIVGESKDTSR